MPQMRYSREVPSILHSDGCLTCADSLTGENFYMYICIFCHIENWEHP